MVIKPFANASSNVSDNAFGMAWFVLFRMCAEDVRYFMDHHPDPRMKQMAKKVWEQNHAPTGT